MKIKFILFIILSCVCSITMSAETSRSVTAIYGLKAPTNDASEKFVISDFKKILAKSNSDNNGRFKVGEVLIPEKTIDPRSSGEWITINERLSMWRIELIVPEAKWVDTKLENLKLPKGTEITVSDTKGRVVWLYSYDELSQKHALYTAAVPGDSLLLEVLVPTPQRETLYLTVGGSTWGSIDRFFATEPMASGSCNVDVVCDVPVINKPITMRSVGQYSFQSGGSTYVCTGSLMASHNSHGGNLTPYFLTADHCLNTQTEADSVVVYWNYQSPECRPPGSSDSGEALPLDFASHSQSGAIWRASYSVTDFTLLELDNLPASGANTYYAGWQRALPSNANYTNVHSIHHPAGHEKRIAINSSGALAASGYLDDPGEGDLSHLRVDDWETGTTEGGSSGAPLFANKWIIGQLHGGYAACGNNEPDWFGSILYSYKGGDTPSSQLRYWLTPNNPPNVITIQMMGHEGP